LPYLAPEYGERKFERGAAAKERAEKGVAEKDRTGARKLPPKP
jgi:hypothetical protein